MKGLKADAEKRQRYGQEWGWVRKEWKGHWGKVDSFSQSRLKHTGYICLSS